MFAKEIWRTLRVPLPHLSGEPLHLGVCGGKREFLVASIDGVDLLLEGVEGLA